MGLNNRISIELPICTTKFYIPNNYMDNVRKYMLQIYLNVNVNRMCLRFFTSKILCAIYIYELKYSLTVLEKVLPPLQNVKVNVTYSRGLLDIGQLSLSKVRMSKVGKITYTLW